MSTLQPVLRGVRFALLDGVVKLEMGKMFRKTMVVLTAAAALNACNRTHVSTAAGEVALRIPATGRALPVGSELEVRTNSKLTGKHNRVGDQFSMTVRENLVAQNGEIAVPEGSMVYGHITALKEAPNAGDPSLVKVDFDRLVVRGRSHPFNAQVTKVSTTTSNETLKKAGIGAAAGAVLGAIVSGGEFGGIALGGAIGAAAGTAISLGMDRDPELPEGTKMTIRATQAVSLR
jgi:hypothetical protein